MKGLKPSGRWPSGNVRYYYRHTSPATPMPDAPKDSPQFLAAYAAASRLGTTQVSIGRWLRGTPCTHERAYRGLMTVLDMVNDTAPTTADSAKSR